MPETDREVLPGEVFVRNLAALASPSVKLKGGIISPDNYKSFVVNIRPNRWQETFWIGQIDNYVSAQFIADTVYYYIGRPAFHLKNANFKYPPLECTGTSTPLTDRDMCLKYASSIAKGSEFKAERVDFRSRVKERALEVVQSVEVQRVLLQFRGESGSAAIPVEGVAGNDGDEGAQVGHPTPMEVDDHSEQATQLSQLVPSSHDGQEVVDRNVEGGNVHIPSFGMNGPEFSLQSDLIPVDDFSWVEAYLGSLENSDLEDHHESLNNDEEFCSATRPLEKNSFNPPQPSSVYDENFGVHFCVMEGAGVDFVNW